MDEWVWWDGRVSGLGVWDGRVSGLSGRVTE